jgi:hypothetical protein
LDEHANEKAAQLGHGTNTLYLQGEVEHSPALGVDWFIGDDIGYVIDAGAPGFPDETKGTVRAVGFQYDFGALNLITPILEGSDAAGGF